MLIDQIEKEISQGNYNSAYKTLEELNSLNNLIYKSRIHELNGRFEIALQLALTAYEAADTLSSKLPSSVALAYVYWRLFQFDKGHTVLNEIEEKLNYNVLETKFLKSWFATLLNIRGLLYWKDNQLEKAENYFENGLQFREELNNKTKISYSLNNLGNTYLKLKNFKKADSYYTKSFNLRRKIGHKPAIAASYNSFGRINDEIGKYDLARDFHLKSLSIWKDVGNNQFIAKSYRFLGLNCIYRQLNDQGLEYLKTSSEIFAMINNVTDFNVNTSLLKKYNLD